TSLKPCTILSKEDGMAFFGIQAIPPAPPGQTDVNAWTAAVKNGWVADPKVPLTEVFYLDKVDGTFSFRHVPPGEYTAIAIEQGWIASSSTSSRAHGACNRGPFGIRRQKKPTDSDELSFRCIPSAFWYSGLTKDSK